MKDLDEKILGIGNKVIKYGIVLWCFLFLMSFLILFTFLLLSFKFSYEVSLAITWLVNSLIFIYFIVFIKLKITIE